MLLQFCTISISALSGVYYIHLSRFASVSIPLRTKLLFISLRDPETAKNSRCRVNLGYNKYDIAHEAAYNATLILLYIFMGTLASFLAYSRVSLEENSGFSARSSSTLKNSDFPKRFGLQKPVPVN